MAQTQSSTNEGYAELGKLVAGETATAVKSVVLIETSCTADATQTYSGITKCTKSGLAIANGTVTSETTTQTDDTVQIVKTHTAGEAATIKGAGMCNDDDTDLYMIVCYNADVSLETNDTLQNTLKMQFKAD